MTVTSDPTDDSATAVPSPHETAGPPVVGDSRSFPSHAELSRTLTGSGGVATLSTLCDSGHPYTSIAPFSTRPDGALLICVSDLAEHTQNLRCDPRAGLLVSETCGVDVDPLSLARVTLVGAFVPTEPGEVEVDDHLVVHPFARHYVHFDDFSWWRFEPINVRYVGGFGFMGWASAGEYATATPDPIIPHAASMIEHLNEDHADASLRIVQTLGSVPAATSVRVTAVDRYGVTFDAHDDTGTIAVSRVAFPDALTEPGAVRAATVDLVRRADGGDDIVVSRHPAADIDPCAMRRVVLSCARPGNPDLSAHIVDIELGGALGDLGGGVFGTRIGAREQRWIPTLLPQAVLADLIDDIGSGSVPAESMAARLAPDCALGVTLLAITSNSPSFDHALDEVAAAAAAACFVAELTRSALPVQQDQPSSGGQS